LIVDIVACLLSLPPPYEALEAGGFRVRPNAP
jgi:hypothetical protein